MTGAEKPAPLAMKEAVDTIVETVLAESRHGPMRR